MYTASHLFLLTMTTASVSQLRKSIFEIISFSRFSFQFISMSSAYRHTNGYCSTNDIRCTATVIHFLLKYLIFTNIPPSSTCPSPLASLSQDSQESRNHDLIQHLIKMENEKGKKSSPTDVVLCLALCDPIYTTLDTVVVAFRRLFPLSFRFCMHPK